MEQREIIRRLCNGALAQILHDNSNNTANSSFSNMSNNNDSILNTLLINTIGNLILKRKTNKSTQTDFNVQRIQNSFVESNHLLPLNKLSQPRKNCIR